MKRKYLVGYDYGMGGLWSYVLAESPEAISRAYPELTVVEQRPTWMNEEAVRSLKVDDIDAPDPEGLLLHVVAERDHP